MKKSTLGIIFTLIIALSFQKPKPVQAPPQLAQAYGALLDSLEKFKHNSFEEAVVRADFLIQLSSNFKNWDIHCKALNLKIVLAEHYDKIDTIELFINDLEKKLDNIDPKYFPQHRFYISEAKLRKSELFSLLRQPDGVIDISKGIIEGIKNNTLAFEDNSKAQQYALYDLAYWTSEIGQITEGINYFLLSKQLNESDTTRELDFAIILYGQLAKRYLSLGQYEQSFKFYTLAQQTTEKLYKKEGLSKQNSGYFVTNFHGISKYYLFNNKPDSALIYLEKASKIAISNQKSENLILSAKCFYLLKKWAASEKKLNEALTEIGDKFEIYTSQKPQIYLQLAQLKYQQQQPAVALGYCQKALKALDPLCDTNRFQNTPSVSRVLMKKELLEVLQFKGKILQDMAQQSADYLAPCYETALLAAHLIDTIRADYTADFDKQYLAQVSYPIYETALDIAFQLYEKEKKDVYLSDILTVMEKSKAAVLLNNLQRGQAETAFSQEDRVKVYQFRKELSGLDKQIFDLTSKGTALTDTALQRLETQRAMMNRQFGDYMEEVRKKYPNYANIKFGAEVIVLADIQKTLPEDGIFIEYFVGENSIYTLAIDHKKAQAFKNDNPQRLPQLVESIRQSIRPVSRDNDRTDIEKYCATASELYDWLFKGPLSISSKKPSFMVVSLDGALNFLPIDILLTEKVTTNFNYRTLPYLLQQASVSYVSSAAIWQAQKKLPHNRAPELFVGFAPQYQYKKQLVNADAEKYQNVLALVEKSGELQDMPNARREVDTIAKLLKSAKTFVGASATEDNFVKYAANYRILHLSMHAEANDKNPAFSQFIFSQNDTLPSHNRLFMNELQNQKLNADLVVLSACETGYGTLKRGEGVMSLARTFTSLGVPTSVVSLWKIPSGTTENVLTQFYDYLTQNKSVLTALRQSKLDYLKTQSLNSPYYWAGLVPIGDTEYVPIANSYGRWMTLLAVLMILAIGFYFFYLKKKYV